MNPKYLYVADLDRIGMCGDHTQTILKIAEKVSEIYVDRGISIPEEYLPKPVINVVGTETADSFEDFCGGILSVDIKDKKVYPTGDDPVEFVKCANKYSFDGFLILNISSVATGCGVDGEFIESLRASTDKKLFYGGGISSLSDLDVLSKAGFDGAVVSTAVHLGKIPISIIREGEYC